MTDRIQTQIDDSHRSHILTMRISKVLDELLLKGRIDGVSALQVYEEDGIEIVGDVIYQEETYNFVSQENLKTHRWIKQTLTQYYCEKCGMERKDLTFISFNSNLILISISKFDCSCDGYSVKDILE